MTEKEILDLDRKHIWHPCSQMKEYEEFPSISIKRGEGVWLYKENGDKILDAVSSWWVNIFGHCNKHIVDKISEQARTLEHVIFANYTHEPAVKLGAYLSGLFDGKLPKIFYGDNGSSGIEIALKMSYHYRVNNGDKKRRKFMYITGGYHGETVGALSVGSVEIFKEVYKPMLFNAIECQGPDCYRCPYGKNYSDCDAECFVSAERLIKKNYKSVTAFIIEPMVQCVAGMKIYSPRYLQKLRETCTKYDIHLICDEIAVGFGRTGKMVASNHAGIVPDFAAVSKGLTGGFLPLSAVLVKEEIYMSFYDSYLSNKAFLHSHSYSGNPLACAAACAVFELFERNDVLSMINEKGGYIKEKISVLKDNKYVGDIRSIGMITAVEIVKDKKTKEPFESSMRIGHSIYRDAEKNGVLLRNIGDIIYFMPPYIINYDEIDFMIKVAIESILGVLNKII